MVDAPFGLASPFIVAELLVTSVAAFVVTVGAASVVKERTEPKDVPYALFAMAQ